MTKIPEQSEEDLHQLLQIITRAKYTWESTFDAILDPVLIIDQNFVIERANLGAAGRAEQPIQDVIGKKCFDVFAGRKDICPGCPLAETLKSGHRHTVEIDELMKDGDFQVNSYPLASSEPSALRRVVHHYRDITEERKLQARLIQSEKMAAIGLLAGGVAHEINNPLAGILAFTQILQKELKAGSQEHKDLSEIEAAAKRCKKIVEDLLAFSRPYAPGDRARLTLPDVLDMILPLARLNLRHQRIELVTEYPPDTLPIFGSASRLQQVFLNLIHNASQSMPEGGRVTVSIRNLLGTKQVAVEVRDTGCGIPAEDLARIFDPFFTTKPRGEGTGLGLSICYSIISDHRGKMEVESRPGRGSLFRVLLPAGDE